MPRKKKLSQETIETNGELSPEEIEHLENITTDLNVPEEGSRTILSDATYPNEGEPQWETNGGAAYPPEDLRQITTKPHTSVYDTNDTASLRIHLSMQEDFIVYARSVNEKHKRVKFFQIAEGPLSLKFINTEDVHSIIPII